MERNVYRLQDYGGFWRRWFASALDGIILVVLGGFIARAGDTSGWLTGTLEILIFLTYMIWFKASMGTTLGYHVLDMKIVSINGAQLTVKQIVIRLISSIFSALVFGLGFIWIAFDANKQAWHDKVAGTYVIRKAAAHSHTDTIPWSGVLRFRWFSFQVLCLAVLVGFPVNYLLGAKRSVAPIVEQYLYALEHDNYRIIKNFSAFDDKLIDQLRRVHVMATDGFGVRQNIQFVGFYQSFSIKEGNSIKVSSLVVYQLGKIQIKFRLKKDGERYTITQVTYSSDLLKDFTPEGLESAEGQRNPP